MLAISDREEPPPSYQDAISDGNNSDIQPSDGDDRQSLRPYGQYCSDEKAKTHNTASNEICLRSEEGTSTLERRCAFRITCPESDEDADESIPSLVHTEDVLEVHQQILLVPPCHVRMQANMALGLRGKSVQLPRPVENVFSTSIPD